jgi:hypothetical protein
MITGEGPRAGQAFQRDRDGAGITTVAGERISLALQPLCGDVVAALFGDEAELGQRQRGAGLKALRTMPVEHVAEVLLGDVELSGAASAHLLRERLRARERPPWAALDATRLPPRGRSPRRIGHRRGPRALARPSRRWSPTRWPPAMSRFSASLTTR